MAVFQLNRESSFTSILRGLPLIDGGGNRNSLHDDLWDCLPALQNRHESWRIELPLGDKAVGRKPTLQSR